jgi:CRP/FNR family transcriptional regulator, cyclic AMP receptor protein
MIRRFIRFLERLSGKDADPETTFYAGIPLLSSLNAKELARVRRLMFERSYEPDELVFLKGQPGAAMFVIREGEVKVLVPNPEGGADIEIARLQAGDFFGELALLDNSPRSASVRSVERTRLSAIFRGDFEDLLLNDPLISSKINRQLAIVIGNRLKAANAELVRERSQARRDAATDLAS